MSERYPGYDTLARRHTPSWNEKTRQAVDKRIAIYAGPRFFDEAEWRVLTAICDRILPQPAGRPRVPIAAYVDEKMLQRRGDGYQYLPLPEQGVAWKRGLKALDETAVAKHGASYHKLPGAEQDALLHQMQKGELKDGAFAEMPSALFFSKRVLFDITAAYYAHPTSWNEIGYGGPASPRGYVRLELNERDPWEPVAAGDDPEDARRKNQRVL